MSKAKGAKLKYAGNGKWTIETTAGSEHTGRMNTIIGIIQDFSDQVYAEEFGGTAKI